MHYYNSLGCLGVLFFFMILFLGFTRLLFTTPLGLIFLAFIAYRMITVGAARRKMEQEVHQQVYEEPEREKDPEDFFESDEVIDIDFEEIDDE